MNILNPMLKNQEILVVLKKISNLKKEASQAQMKKCQ
jgi:hypothetical protein